MKKLRTKKQLFLYSISGLGINMLNLIVGSYLCDALMTEGFDKNVENWTYLNKTLVVAAVWSVMITVAKILDGVIDLPFASFTDNLKSRFGKRRPAILMGFVPLIVSYLLFLLPLSGEASLPNTLWFGGILCLFYSAYTMTMVTYYATFSEITANDEDRLFLSNCKSAFDVVYFVLGYALIPAFIGSMNIRVIALIFLPLALTMLIPFFLIKEKSTLPEDVAARETAGEEEEDRSLPEEEKVGLIPSVVYTLKNKTFVLWMIVYAVLEFGLQLFITAQNVYYSGTMQLDGGQITVIMASVFAPVPATLVLYNKIVNRFGFRVGYLYSLGTFLIGMLLMLFCTPANFPDGTARMLFAAAAGIFTSFGIGSFFSVGYTVPSELAAEERRTTGVSHPAMYFAVQGLASGVATAIATGVIWVNLKDAGLSHRMPLFVIGMLALSCVLIVLLPKSLDDLGRSKKRS